MATQMTPKKSNSSPKNSKVLMISPVTITGQDDSKKVEALTSKDKSITPSPTPLINPNPISKPQASTLESWAQAYDSKKTSKNKGALNLTSAFQRPTYTAAPLKRGPSSTSQSSVPNPSTPVLENANVLTSKPIQSSPRSSKSDIMSELEALIAECRRPPNPTPTTTYPAASEAAWIATSTFTLPQLNHVLHRLCSELNWDWYGTKYHTLNPNSTPALSKIWRMMVSSMYELYCVERARPEKSVWKMLVHVEGGEEGALGYFRRQVHNVMMFWVDVEGRGNEEGVIEVVTQEGKEKLKHFGEALLSDGDILKFVREKARSVGLVYPEGTGRFEERIRMMTRAKERAGYEHMHGHI